jgi:hypothetical protein
LLISLAPVHGIWLKSIPLLLHYAHSKLRLLLLLLVLLLTRLHIIATLCPCTQVIPIYHQCAHCLHRPCNQYPLLLLPMLWWCLLSRLTAGAAGGVAAPAMVVGHSL